jgi:hypothetical protein
LLDTIELAIFKHIKVQKEIKIEANNNIVIFSLLKKKIIIENLKFLEKKLSKQLAKNSLLLG